MSDDAKEQNAFVTRMFSVVVMALVALGLWVGASILFTPLPLENPEGVLFLRGLLMFFGLVVVMIGLVATIMKLYDW